MQYQTHFLQDLAIYFVISTSRNHDFSLYILWQTGGTQSFCSFVIKVSEIAGSKGSNFVTEHGAVGEFAPPKHCHHLFFSPVPILFVYLFFFMTHNDLGCWYVKEESQLGKFCVSNNQAVNACCGLTLANLTHEFLKEEEK